MTDTANTNKPTDVLAAEAKDDGTHTFTLDGREVSAKKGELLIAAAERAGTYLHGRGQITPGRCRRGRSRSRSTAPGS